MNPEAMNTNKENNSNSKSKPDTTSIEIMSEN